MGKIAFVFPGQGSQRVGMGKALFDSYPAARDIYNQADQLLGFSISELCFYGPEETLKATETAQPALYVTSLAALKCFEQVCSRKPDATAGHSVGEYAALTAAGVLDFSDGVKLVRKRGELMRDAANAAPGTMAAILGIDSESAREACAEARSSGAGVVAVANFNGGGQVVISGEARAVEKAGEIAKSKGAKRVMPLAVSGGFHSPLMVTAGDSLFASLSQTTFRKPRVPIVTNVSAKYVEMADDVIGGLTMQVSRSVRWEESMQFLLAEGVDTFIEFGSGEVLTGLMRRMNKNAVVGSVQDPATLEAVSELIGAEPA